TGVHETTIGDYEVTPTAFEIVESVNGVEPDNGNFNFIIIDVTVKNIGDTVLDGKEVAKIDLRDAEDFVRSNKKQYDFVNHFEEVIEPGEEVEGQFIFTSLPDLEYYDLIFGLHRSGVANELTWRFTQDDLK